MTDKELEEAVKRWYSVQRPSTGKDLKSLDWNLMDRFGISGHTVLNLGPYTTVDEQRYAASAAEWHAVDFVPEVAERCRAEMPQVNWHTADIRALPFADAHFTRVLALSTIEHIPSHEGRVQAHSEAARVLKDGGLYILAHSDRLRLDGLRPQDETARFGYERSHLLHELIEEVMPSGLNIVHYMIPKPMEWIRAGSIWVKGEWKGLGPH